MTPVSSRLIGHVAPTVQPERVYYLDWLRASVVLLLIPFHTACIFLPAGWWVDNTPSSPVALAFYQVLEQFQMPLLFTIAGAATWFSLGVRTAREYFSERLGRLAVPIIFGMLIWNAPNYFASVMHHGRGVLYDYSYFNWYQTYLKTMLFPWQKGWGPGTLWFIWYLFIYSLALLPLIMLVRRWKDSRFFRFVSRFLGKRGALLLLAIPPALVTIYPPPNVYSGFPITHFVFFFLYGLVIYASPETQHGVEKTGPLALVSGVICMTLAMLLIFPAWNKAVLGSIYWPALRGEQGTLGQALYQIIRNMSRWFWILGLIYLAKRHLNFTNRFLRYANEAVLPLYLIHGTFIVAIGYYVVQWSMGVLPKFTIIALSSLVATLALYELVKRASVTRFFFGMRLQRSPRRSKEAVSL